MATARTTPKNPVRTDLIADALDVLADHADWTDKDSAHAEAIHRITEKLREDHAAVASQAETAPVKD